jgi:hypothetical protein
VRIALTKQPELSGHARLNIFEGSDRDLHGIVTATIVTCIEIEIGDVESGEEKTPEVLDLACSADGYEQYQTSV